MFFKKKNKKKFFQKVVDITEKNKDNAFLEEIIRIKRMIMNAALEGRTSIHTDIYAPSGLYNVIKQEIKELGFQVEESPIKDIYISWAKDKEEQ